MSAKCIRTVRKQRSYLWVVPLAPFFAQPAGHVFAGVLRFVFGDDCAFIQRFYWSEKVAKIPKNVTRQFALVVIHRGIKGQSYDLTTEGFYDTAINDEASDV